MVMKIYSKKGATNYMEKRLIKALETAIEKKMAENSNFEFTTARTFDELKALHNELVIEDAVVIGNETKSDKPIDNENIIDGTTNAKEQNAGQFEQSKEQDIEDPFNRQEPIVRPYVLEDEFATPLKETENKNATFDEPKSFQESFETFDKEGKSNQTTEKKGEKREDKKEPINPFYKTPGENQSKSKKRNKRFAKYIVEGVCFLLKKGVVWYATKDISEEKLMEYQLSGEVSGEALQLLVTLDGGQQSTVKNFFSAQCIKADKITEISEEEKEDLTEALEEYLESKGITPSAGQNLLTVAISVLGKPIAEGFMMSTLNTGIINQLKDMHKNTENAEQYYEEPPQPQRNETPEPMRQEAPARENALPKTGISEVKDLLEIETVKETIE